MSANIPGAHKMSSYSNTTFLPPQPRKSSSKHFSDSGVGSSHLSDLSRVSGNIPGAHKMTSHSNMYIPRMPTYSYGSSFLPEGFLLPKSSTLPPYKHPPPYNGHWYSTLLTVLNYLTHSKDCAILHCPCMHLKSRYQQLEDGSVPLQQKSRTNQYKSPYSVLHSDSGIADYSKKARTSLSLKLKSENIVDPHYHTSTRSLPKFSQPMATPMTKYVALSCDNLPRLSPNNSHFAYVRSASLPKEALWSPVQVINSCN